jgi:TQXA domain-containing protein
MSGGIKMKLKKYIKLLSYFIIFNILMSSIIIGADAVDTAKIITEKQPLYTVQYDGYDLTARRIRVEGSNNVAYCLEINKKYPSGQNFSLNANPSEVIHNIVAAGYPNRSVAELNLDNENEAYFATQIAIWSSMEGYDVNKIKGDNPKIIEAIKNIYNDGMSGKYTSKIRIKEYKTNDESIQDIIVVSTDDLVSEEKAESIQTEYAPQEG